ncbi:MAG TPA: SpoIID/LytB domain-containing protein, partial [Nitrospiria bacterium]|nr:SpoIID/LytB domain-containing protein [Nitrospiria bacterium]
LQAFFHSTSAGPTEDASEVWGVDLPYLKGVSCPLDEGSPYFNWTASFPMTQLRSALIREGWRAGTIASVTPIRWTGAGRVDRIQILHSLGEIILKGNDFRRILGYSKLPSTRFIIQNVGPKLHVQGLGAGHAVGLCQWGAKQMAEMGYTHESILHHYYPGSKIQLTSDEPDIVLIP